VTPRLPVLDGYDPYAVTLREKMQECVRIAGAFVDFSI
jgi:hypothetical protein